METTFCLGIYLFFLSYEAYLEGMETVFRQAFHHLPRRTKPTLKEWKLVIQSDLLIVEPEYEAYLEGMETASNRCTARDTARYEAYLEGMETRRMRVN